MLERAPSSRDQALEGSSRPWAADFAGLYRAHATMVRRIVLAGVGRGPHVDDLVQSVFLRAWQARRGFVPRGADPELALASWLSKISRNAVRSYRRIHWPDRRTAHRRDLAREGLVPAPVETPEQSALRREWFELVSARLRAVAERSPDEYVRLVEAHVVHEVPYRTLAQRLHTTEGALRVRAHRLCRRLRVELEGVWQARP